ncbi:MAG: type I methionyl aminopeptidase [Bacteroidales bacterium]|nr:type I methionyl aminopeptidase [Bacteroidales bacterium]
MIRTYSPEEIEKIRESSLLVGKTLAEVAKVIAPGVKTMELERVADAYIRSVGGVPGFKGYEGFPYALCISVNEMVVHGYPSEYELKEGDIVSVDCGVYKNGFHGDSAYTFAVGKVSEPVRRLMEDTKASLYEGIKQAVAGNRTGDIGWAIQQYTESRGYGVVRELCGHGVGEKLHDKPDVPNFGHRGCGTKLKANSVIAIEPMITLGKRHIGLQSNGWGIYTLDGQPAAHYEHDVLITKEGPDILSSFDEIEAVINSKH